MEAHMSFLYILAWPLGYVMELIYNIIPNYGWDLILFTLLIRLLSIPLSLKQQKNMVRMTAFQPMIEEIQKKYKDKPDKQQEEMLRLQQDFGYNPTSGCLPMLLNFFVMFGVIGVVYEPLNRIFHISNELLTSAGTALTNLGIQFTNITRDNLIIEQVVAGEKTITSIFSAGQLETITEFSKHMSFFGIDLTKVPQYSLSAENLPLHLVQHEQQRPEAPGQHEDHHVYHAPDVYLLLLHGAHRILAVLCHFQHRDGASERRHEEDLRSRKGQGRSGRRD